MKTIFLVVYALTAFALFRSFPADEAVVRCAIIALAYVCVYVALRSVIRLVQRHRQNGMRI